MRMLASSWCVRFPVAVLLLCFVGTLGVAAQEKHHVVPLQELNKAAAQPAQARQADETAVHQLLSSEAGQKALKLAGTDYEKATKAVGQLSDEELTKLAQRSREAQNDFAAGRLSDRDLLWIILIIVAVLVIALALR